MVDLKPYLQDSASGTACVPSHYDSATELSAVFLRLLDFLPGELLCPVLDIGPGDGWMSLRLQERYSEVHAITLFEDEARRCRENGVRSVTVGDMHDMPAEWSGVFGGLWASHVLEHSPAPYVFLKECHRVMVPGGTLVLVAPEPKGYVGLGNKHPFRCGDMTLHVFCASIDTVIEIARHAGLSFDGYHEVPQTCGGVNHYYHRVWVMSKP